MFASWWTFMYLIYLADEASRSLGLPQKEGMKALYQIYIAGYRAGYASSINRR